MKASGRSERRLLPCDDDIQTGIGDMIQLHFNIYVAGMQEINSIKSMQLPASVLHIAGKELSMHDVASKTVQFAVLLIQKIKCNILITMVEVQNLVSRFIQISPERKNVYTV